MYSEPVQFWTQEITGLTFPVSVYAMLVACTCRTLSAIPSCPRPHHLSSCSLRASHFRPTSTPYFKLLTTSAILGSRPGVRLRHMYSPGCTRSLFPDIGEVPDRSRRVKAARRCVGGEIHVLPEAANLQPSCAKHPVHILQRGTCEMAEQRRLTVFWVLWQ